MTSVSGYKKSSFSRWAMTVIAAVLLGAGGLMIYARRDKIAPGLVSDEPARSAQVPTVEVSSVLVPITYTVVGTVESVTPVDAASRVAARVLNVKVRAGQHVHSGQVLVELDSADLRAQLSQAQAELKAAEAEFVRAQADYERFAALIKHGSVTRQEFDAAQAAYRSATGNRARAQAAVEAAKAALSYSTVKAPVDGIVEERLVEPGDMALPGKPLVRLYDERALRVSLEVPERLAQQVNLGMPIEVDFGPQFETITTRINEIVPAADPTSRSFVVRASLPSNRGLRPGMFARARLRLGQETIITIPASAVRYVGQIPTVGVFEQGKILTRQIATGRSFGDRVEVLAGLSAGERVIVSYSRAESRHENR